MEDDQARRNRSRQRSDESVERYLAAKISGLLLNDTQEVEQRYGKLKYNLSMSQVVWDILLEISYVF